MYAFMNSDCEYRSTITTDLPVEAIKPLFEWADSDAVKPWTLVYAQSFATYVAGRAHVKFIFEKALFK